jgi:cell wall-associated NlpC family hydrolase
VPSSKLAQARTVKAQIEELDHRVEAAAERYNEASMRHASLLKQKKQAGAKLDKLKKRIKVVNRHLNTRASSMYRTGPMGFVDVLLGAESFEEFATTWDVLRDLNESDADAISELKKLRIEARKAHKVYTAKEKAAGEQKAAMRAQENTVRGELAERKRKLAGIENEIAALEAAERRARAATAARLVSRPAAIERSFPAPTRAPRSEVVSIAKRYLGAPYEWAAAGPNSFDCSGFTMFVYRQVGVYLPHSSRAQIGYGERVSRANLQPGDLVFFGSPIHHVGIYVGGGMMIHAPHTGAVVRIDPLHSNYAGACRP